MSGVSASAGRDRGNGTAVGPVARGEVRGARDELDGEELLRLADGSEPAERSTRRRISNRGKG